MSFEPRSATILSGAYAWAQYAPHPSIAAWISSLWTLQARGAHTVRTLPDACVDLIVSLDPEPRAFLAAPQPRSQRRVSRVGTRLVGARLLPGAAVLLGITVEVLAEPWTPLEAWLPEPAVRRLLRDVSRAEGEAGQVRVLESFLTARLVDRSLDGRLARALVAVFAASGDVSVASLARGAGAHPRTLARLFERGVGLSPKRFARIVRVQAVLRAHREQPSWAQVADELGYSDQAHLIRDVRELFGATPGELSRVAGRTR